MEKPDWNIRYRGVYCLVVRLVVSLTGQQAVNGYEKMNGIAW